MDTPRRDPGFPTASWFAMLFRGSQITDSFLCSDLSSIQNEQHFLSHACHGKHTASIETHTDIMDCVVRRLFLISNDNELFSFSGCAVHRVASCVEKYRSVDAFVRGALPPRHASPVDKMRLAIPDAV